MTKHDCVHECPTCRLLTTCLPNCTGEQKYEERICKSCESKVQVKVAA